MKWTIGKRLIGGFVLILLLALGALGYSIQQTRKMVTAYEQMLDHDMQAEVLAKDLDAAEVAQSAAAFGFLIDQNPAFWDEYLANQKEIAADLEELEARAHTAALQTAAAQVKQDASTYASVVDGVYTRKTFTLPDQQATMAALAPLRTALGTSMDRLTALAGEEVQATRDAVMRQQRLSMMLTGVAGLGALILGLIIALSTARSVGRAVRAVAALAAQLADGDLTAEPLQIKSRDEIGAMAGAVNRMHADLRRLLGQVADSARQVTAAVADMERSTGQMAGAAREVSGAIGQVAGGAASQAESAENASGTVAELRAAVDQIASGAQAQARDAGETVRVVTEIVSAIEEVAEKASGATALAGETASRAERGGQVVEHAVAGMGVIGEAVIASTEQVRSLAGLSDQIGSIINVITEIADQTNLLALNAAIEAARAGEHGRGFAVVAEEVRRLAERSATSAREIGDLLGQIQRQTLETEARMDQVAANVKQGQADAAESIGALNGILEGMHVAVQNLAAITAATEQLKASSQAVVEAVNAVAAVTEENTAATEEMAAGADQVTDAVQSIAATSEENAAAAEEAAASVEELNTGAEAVAATARNLSTVAAGLQEQVSRFKL
jgi:methyl-accepting chemotaxis protein